MIIGPGSVLVLIPGLVLSFFGSPGMYKIKSLQYWGVLPIAAGLVISLRCVYDFIFTGRGTPVPIDPPEKLVIIGLYRFVRNPMYLGILFLLFGEAILFKSFILLGYTLCVFGLFHIFIVGFEEPMLKAKFGKAYEHYCSRVPRWFILPGKERSGGSDQNKNG